MPFKKVFVSLGSNIGGRYRYINSAIDEIKDLCCTSIISKSKLMETKPIDTTGQKDYLNQIILIKTQLSPQELLIEFKRIEKELGRKKRDRWAEREIDIDIIIYEGVTILSPALTIPHKEFTNRLFVLQGCMDLDPDYVVESLGASIKEIYFKNIGRLKEQVISCQTS